MMPGWFKATDWSSKVPRLFQACHFVAVIPGVWDGVSCTHLESILGNSYTVRESFEEIEGRMRDALAALRVRASACKA